MTDRTVAPPPSDRGVSVTLNYVLGLAIATLLVSSLLFATGNVIEDRREASIRSELTVVGERVAGGVTMADRLARTGARTVALETDGPTHVAGEGYTVSLDATTEEVVLETVDPDVVVRIPFHNTTPVRSSTAKGGEVVVVLNDAGELEVDST